MATHAHHAVPLQARVVEAMQGIDKPTVGPRMLAESPALQKIFKKDSDYLARTLSGMYIARKVGRCPASDAEYGGTFGYALPHVAGVTMAPDKGSYYQQKKARLKKAKSALMPAHVPKRMNGHAMHGDAKQPAPMAINDDDVVIESGNARITMSLGKITIEPRRR